LQGSEWCSRYDIEGQDADKLLRLIKAESGSVGRIRSGVEGVIK